ncbi:MAG: hypothetical protein ACYCOZ_12595 [Metallibacterium scheffleri]
MIAMHRANAVPAWRPCIGRADGHVVALQKKVLTSAHPAFYFRIMFTRTAPAAHVRSAPVAAARVLTVPRITSADFACIASLLAAALYLLAILLIRHGAAG